METINGEYIEIQNPGGHPWSVIISQKMKKATLGTGCQDWFNSCVVTGCICAAVVKCMCI